MRSFVSVGIIVLALAMGVIPNGMCPGCMGPRCLFANSAQSTDSNDTCSCCAGKSEKSAPQATPILTCCFKLSNVISAAKANHSFQAAAMPPEIGLNATDSAAVQLEPANARVFFGRPPNDRLFIVIRTLLI